MHESVQAELDEKTLTELVRKMMYLHNGKKVYRVCIGDKRIDQLVLHFDLSHLEIDGHGPLQIFYPHKLIDSSTEVVSLLWEVYPDGKRVDRCINLIVLLPLFALLVWPALSLGILINIAEAENQEKLAFLCFSTISVAADDVVQIWR